VFGGHTGRAKRKGMLQLFGFLHVDLSIFFFNNVYALTFLADVVIDWIGPG